MNENELKSIERYFNKFNEDAASFNEFEANDFIKLLKNNGRNDDAIEVGNTFLQMAPSLKGYINQYGYALYNKFINIDDLSIDLIDQVNPFQSAYEVISRDVDTRTLQLIARTFDAKKFEFTNDELRMLYPKIKSFQAEFGRPPKKDSKDVGEQRLYYALARLAQLRQERNN